MNQFRNSINRLSRASLVVAFIMLGTIVAADPISKTIPPTLQENTKLDLLKNSLIVQNKEGKVEAETELKLVFLKATTTFKEVHVDGGKWDPEDIEKDGTFTATLKSNGAFFATLVASVKGKEKIEKLATAMKKYAGELAETDEAKIKTQDDEFKKVWDEAVGSSDTGNLELKDGKLEYKSVNTADRKADDKVKALNADVSFKDLKVGEVAIVDVTITAFVWATDADKTALKASDIKVAKTDGQNEITANYGDLKLDLKDQKQIDRFWKTVGGGSDGGSDDAWYKSWWFITIVIVAVVALVVLAVYCFISSNKDK